MESVEREEKKKIHVMKVTIGQDESMERSKAKDHDMTDPKLEDYYKRIQSKLEQHHE